jgi:L-fucose mutarotase
MLYNIPPVITPKLMKTLMEMGHGDEIVLSDGNFPARSMNNRIIRCDGSGIPELLDAVAQFFPLDYAAEHSVVMMETTPGMPEPPVWDAYRMILKTRCKDKFNIQFLSRQAFYERARLAFAVVTTGEKTRFANILLKKGVVRFDD